MAYLPKSKYSIKTTQGDHLVYKNDTSKYYIGKYILMSNGRHYAGTNTIYLGDELILRDQEHNEGDEDSWVSKDVQKHKYIKKDIDKFLTKVTPIPYEKPKPTEKEYKKGVFTRYFAKRINGEHYMEISKKTAEDLSKKDKKYDFNLYRAGSLRWHLTGNVFKKNSISIKIAQKTFRTINYFFHKLDEYKLEEKILRINLYTEGKELYLENGEEYIGEYHVHESGPMVGPVHTDSFHPKLYYSKTSSIPKSTNIVKDTSGGGGGGY